ncbi:hypothetical protein AVEN_125633-1 [Araneus ventricosus]|uniref:Uncharacterized protein n=1 Tax=Araneus ventricosus TaxID=182803 RepID=A0A4Y2M9H3_ARAVE|nr:hypothetical protein AVEN_125633-1 [Araneus ventricosus]
MEKKLTVFYKSRINLAVLQFKPVDCSAVDDGCTPVVIKLRNYPTVGIEHWGHGSLVVGRPVVQWSERKAELHPLRRDKKRGVGVGTRRAVKNRFRKSRTWFQTPESRKSCVISSDFKSRLNSDLDNDH